MPDPSPKVLLVGNTEASELFPVARFIYKEIHSAEIQQHDDIPTAINAINGNQWFPDLVVVLQQWPDEFASADVQQFIGLVPLARWVCCFSSWCEADGRNRAIWPLSTRISARTAESRIRAELEVITRQRDAVPLTASRDESFEFDSLARCPETETPATIQVISPDNEFASWLIDLLIQANHNAIKISPNISPAAVLWDADPWRVETATAMRQFTQQHPETPILALMNTATPEEIETVKAAGAVTVVAKLSTNSSLLQAVQKMLSANSGELKT